MLLLDVMDQMLYLVNTLKWSIQNSNIIILRQKKSTIFFISSKSHCTCWIIAVSYPEVDQTALERKEETSEILCRTHLEVMIKVTSQSIGLDTSLTFKRLNGGLCQCIDCTMMKERNITNTCHYSLITLPTCLCSNTNIPPGVDGKTLLAIQICHMLKHQ